ncbi:MAG: bacillithiol system redox-active protein YtxJ [bacterium]|nr:bacillithiol system redox-active protein YtxJ [bacterium]
MQAIKNKVLLDKALEKSNHEPILIFKHSDSCPVSSEAYDEVLKFEKKVETPIFLIVVQDNRDESNQVEQVLEIKHESPQIILVNESHAKLTLNHEDVTEDNLFEMMMKFE